MTDPRRPLRSLSLTSLLDYGEGMADLAQTHLAAQPAAAARIARLRELVTRGQADYAAWSADAREQTEAFDARDRSFAAGRELYRYARQMGQVLVREGAGGGDLRGLLQRCPPPSQLAPDGAFLAFEDLAAGAEVHADLFATAGVDPAQVADLRAQAQALQAAVNHLTRAGRERGETSGRRKEGRAALLAQLRVMEIYLRAALPPDGLTGLETLRNRFLPRYARTGKDDPVEPEG